jgi:hypothetical protein
MNLERLELIEREHLQHIRGKVADAIRERIERISKATCELNKHLKDCPDCKVEHAPFKLCPKGNLLLNTVLEL